MNDRAEYFPYFPENKAHLYAHFVCISAEGCILRAPAVADALTTGRGAVIERSAGGAGQDCL